MLKLAMLHSSVHFIDFRKFNLNFNYKLTPTTISIFKNYYLYVYFSLKGIWNIYIGQAYSIQLYLARIQFLEIFKINIKTVGC